MSISDEGAAQDAAALRRRLQELDLEGVDVEQLDVALRILEDDCRVPVKELISPSGTYGQVLSLELARDVRTLLIGQRRMAEQLRRLEEDRPLLRRALTTSSVDRDAPVAPVDYTRSRSAESAFGLSLESLEMRAQLAQLPTNSEVLAAPDTCQGFKSALKNRVFTVTTDRSLQLVEHVRQGNCCMALQKAQRHCMVRPNSWLRIIVDLLSALVLSYDLLSMPYLLAFDLPMQGHIFYMQCVSLGFWCTDILVNFRTGYYTDDGHLEMRPMLAAAVYVRGMFMLDLFVVVVDGLGVWASASGPTSIKVVRIIKISRFARLISALRALSVTHAVDRLAERVEHKNLTHTILVLFKFLVIILAVCHWLACFWCFMGRGELLESDTGITWLDLPTGQDVPLATYGDSHQFYQYTTAMHWTITQMTPGSMQVFPVNSVERIFNVILLLLGMVVFSTLISSISSVVMQHRIKKQTRVNRMERLNRFIRENSISSTLALRIRHDLGRPKPVAKLVVKDVEVINELPRELRGLLQEELHSPIILQHLFFVFAQKEDAFGSKGEEACTFLKSVCQSCTASLALARNEMLFKAGEESSGMYFVRGGCLSYHRPPLLTEEAEQGRHLCEAALWCNWRHLGKAEVVDVALCDILRLGVEPFLLLLPHHPRLAQIAAAYARSFMAALNHAPDSLLAAPSDLHMPFGADEVIATMDRETKMYLGQLALKVVQESPLNFSSWLLRLSEDNTQRLQEEVSKGQSTLLITGDGAIERFVPLVVLHLERDDGRLLVRVQAGTEDREASCKLPGEKQANGELPEQTFADLLRTQLGDIKDAIDAKISEKESHSEVSRAFGVRTRYMRTIFNSSWGRESDQLLRPFTRRALQEQGPAAPGARRAEPALGTLSEPLPEYPEFYVLSTGKMYTWLTPEQLKYAGTERGKSALNAWLSDSLPHPGHP